MKELIIRREMKEDYAAVEQMTREAFWNIYAPGCDEHYLVHVMREHEDFVPELDLVAEWHGQIIGNVMYTKAVLTGEAGEQKQVLTFGPLSVLPEFQRKGVGRSLLESSFEKALELGYDTIVIYGNPYNICIENDIFPTAMLVKELKPNVFNGEKWYYNDSSLYNVDDVKAREFDRLFEPKERGYQPSQEEFYIYSHSILR